MIRKKGDAVFRRKGDTVIRKKGDTVFRKKGGKVFRKKGDTVLWQALLDYPGHFFANFPIKLSDMYSISACV